jgi:pimeloyl-ACP methyl ester carboxylesterase
MPELERPQAVDGDPPVIGVAQLTAGAKMVPTTNTVELDRRLPNSQLVIYPDAGHGGVFQFHEDFVERALEFL